MVVGKSGMAKPFQKSFASEPDAENDFPMSVTYSIDRDTVDKLRAWQQVVRKVFVSVDMKIEYETRFCGEMIHAPLDQLDIVWVKADGEAVRRTRHHITSNPGDSCVVMLVTRGAVRISQYGRTADVVAGTLSALDLDAPYAHEHSGASETYFLRVPNAMSRTRFREIRDHCAVPRPVTRGVRGIAADLIASLCRHAIGTEAYTAATLAAQIIDVVSLAFDAPPGDPPSPGMWFAGARSLISTITSAIWTSGRSRSPMPSVSR